MVLTYLHQVDSSTTALWMGLFPIAGCLVSFYNYCFTESFVFNANSADPDQTQHSAIIFLGDFQTKMA